MQCIARFLERLSTLLNARLRGRHRAVCRDASAPRIPALTSVAVEPASRLFDHPLFADPAFDGERDMVRPYVLVYERRRALEWALDGADVGPRWVGVGW